MGSSGTLAECRERYSSNPLNSKCSRFSALKRPPGLKQDSAGNFGSWLVCHSRHNIKDRTLNMDVVTPGREHSARHKSSLAMRARYTAIVKAFGGHQEEW